MSAQPEQSIRLIVWGLSHPETADIVRQLGAMPDVKLAAWFGLATDCTHNAFDFFKFHRDYEFRTPAVTEALYNDVYKDLHIFMDMFSRHNRDAKRRPVKLYTLHDYIHIFNRYIYYFADLISRQDVNLVLFASNVHEGPDFILYKICKFLGIETVILYQSLFPNRYMYLRTLRDLSRYYQDPSVTLNPPKERITLERRSKLFYMSNLKHSRFEFKELWAILKKDLLRMLRKKQFDEIVARSMYLIKYMDYKAYRKNVDSLLCHNFSLNVPYVYFPLNYQPEMTTSSLGGVYVDQLLALERLSQLLPQNWLIYIKEHVIQTEFMRGNWFFERLRQIENVRLLPMETNTFELTENAMFVSTVTGTAGWEALKHGKKALIFGSVWYEGLPGIFRYAEGFNLQALLDFEMDMPQLEDSINCLVAKMEEGVTESVFACLVPDFDANSNALKVSAFLHRLFLELLSVKKTSVAV